MRSIETLLDEAAEQTGWNTEAKLASLIEFLSQYPRELGSFELYLEEKVEEVMR